MTTNPPTGEAHTLGDTILKQIHSKHTNTSCGSCLGYLLLGARSVPSDPAFMFLSVFIIISYFCILFLFAVLFIFLLLCFLVSFSFVIPRTTTLTVIVFRFHPILYFHSGSGRPSTAWAEVIRSLAWLLFEYILVLLV